MIPGRHHRNRHRPKRTVVFLWLIVMISFFTSGAKNSNPEKNLQTIEQQLKEKQAEYQHITRREQQLLRELKAIDQQIRTYQQQLQQHQASLEQKAADLKKLEQNLAQSQTSLQHKKTLLIKRLRAIYKMGNLGYFTPLLAVASYDNLQQQIKYLQLISEQDQRLIADVEQDRQKILAQKKAIEDQKQQIIQTQKDIEQEQKQIAAQKNQKDTLLNTLQKEKTQYAQMIASLETSREELERLIKKLEEREPTPSKKVVSAVPGKDVTLPENSAEVVEAYGKYFRSNKGKLLWPVQGKIITTFGNIKIPGTKTYTHYKGVDIQTAKGTPFYAVFKGKVKYADWFKGYGNLIILDHGGNYYTLYAHADQILVNAGDQVDTRQVLGKVGDTDSVKGAHLYFEVRANGKPEDPQRWLAKLR